MAKDDPHGVKQMSWVELEFMPTAMIRCVKKSLMPEPKYGGEKPKNVTRGAGNVERMLLVASARESIYKKRR